MRQKILKQVGVLLTVSILLTFLVVSLTMYSKFNGYMHDSVREEAEYIRVAIEETEGDYLNEKINPIAPHITDQGATTVVNTIDKTFAKTIAQVGLDLASSILHYSQSPQMAEYMRNLNGNLTTMADTLSGASQQVTSYSQLLGSANDIVDSTGKLLASATKAGKQAQNALKQGKSGATSFTSAGANVTSSVNTALDQVSGAFDQVAAKVNKAFAEPSDRQGLRHRSQPVDSVERTSLQRRIAVRHVHHKPQPHARIGGTTTGQ